MKTLFCLLLGCALLLPLGAEAADVSTPLTEANRLYAEKNYEAARNAYAQMLDSGLQDAAVFLNLGHVEYRLGHPVMAAVNYRRALALDPSDVAARSSLEHVQRELGLPAPGVGFADIAGQYIPFDILSILGSVLFWVGLLLVLYAVFSTRRRTGLVAVGVLIALAGATAAVVSWTGDTRITLEHVSIVTDPSAVRNAPAENAQKLSDLKKGTEVRVLASRDNWSFVRLPDGPDGWIPSASLEPVFLRGKSTR